MKSEYSYSNRRLRVRVGDDILNDVAHEVFLAGGTRALILTMPSRTLRQYAEMLLEALGERGGGIFDQALPHVPRGAIEAAKDAMKAAGADCCITLGGGSATGLGKALALEAEAHLPVIAVATTYAGSEATSIWGISENGRKATGRDDRVAPTTILYIPAWTSGLPVDLSTTSGINAVAHCVEALYAVDASPMTTLLAEEGVRAMAHALPRIKANPKDPEARAEALWGAHLAGRALDSASMALHHKLCHVIGGTFQMAHAATHTVILPYATAYNAPAAPEAMRAVARALGRDDREAAMGLFELNRALEVPPSLEAIGFKEAYITQTVDEVLQKTYPNPRPIEKDGLIKLLTDAFHGNPPGEY
ncbi:MAG: maleylacetate reductase [Myxococcota bacterium]